MSAYWTLYKRHQSLIHDWNKGIGPVKMVENSQKAKKTNIFSALSKSSLSFANSELCFCIVSISWLSRLRYLSDRHSDCGCRNYRFKSQVWVFWFICERHQLLVKSDLVLVLVTLETLGSINWLSCYLT